MKSTPCRATGEAMPLTVDPCTIEASADLLALLSVCTFAAQRMAEGDEDAADMAADVTRCLHWAESLARQTHDDIAMLRRIQLRQAA